MRVAMPVLLPIRATPELEELQVGLTVLLLVSVAVNVTEPEAKDAVNPPVVCEVQPVHAMVKPVLLCVLTVRVVLAVCFPEVAVMVVLPRLVPAVASPELLMVAIFADEDDQVTVEEMSLVLLLPNVPVALNCCVLLG